jgi:hypothetical protein
MGKRWTNRVFCEMVISLLDNVLDIDDPVLKPGAGHFKKSSLPRVVVGLTIGAGDLEKLGVQGVERALGVRIDFHDELGVDLNLLELLTVGLIAVPAELIAHGGKTIGQHLPLLVALREESWGAIGSSVGSGCGRRIGHGNIVRSHDCCVISISWYEGCLLRCRKVQGALFQALRLDASRRRQKSEGKSQSPVQVRFQVLITKFRVNI